MRELYEKEEEDEIKQSYYFFLIYYDLIRKFFYMNFLNYDYLLHTKLVL